MDRRAPALMFQGTASNAGKSLICAGVCRILANAGYKVAPFKAQNMSLNSCATANGEEMSRAQYLQARAARIPPDARMNPVLLKPLGERGSQIVVMGESFGVMDYREYVRNKPAIWKIVLDAFESLSRESDIVILEGAGSPAEINLRRHDIANMGIARKVGASAIIVADIDRGGAFAALAGTMALLSRNDRRLVKGFLLNKFRGDVSLLDSALARIERLCRRPFFGVVPLFPDLRLPEEDSVGFKEKSLASCVYGKSAAEDRLDIVVPDLPSISNFTDLDPFFAEPDAAARVVSSAQDLGWPDLVLIPGSRNIGRDLDFLQGSGLRRAIINYADKIRGSGRGAIVGLCGGLQALGTTAVDLAGEETLGEVPCLGLLPVRSELKDGKITRQRNGRAIFPDLDAFVSGYEIHRGRTKPDGEAKVCVVSDDGEPLGYADPAFPDRIWGTYLHGIFDNDLFRREFLEKLRRRKGLPSREISVYDPDAQLDLLAEGLKESIDLPRMFSLLGEDFGAKFRRF